jgi:hypothetical protein
MPPAGEPQVSDIERQNERAYGIDIGWRFQVGDKHYAAAKDENVGRVPGSHTALILMPFAR